jgi:hypothetical protein
MPDFVNDVGMIKIKRKHPNGRFLNEFQPKQGFHSPGMFKLSPDVSV